MGLSPFLLSAVVTSALDTAQRCSLFARRGPESKDFRTRASPRPARRRTNRRPSGRSGGRFPG